MKNKRNLLIASTTLLLSVVAISMVPVVGSASGFTNGGGIKSNMFKASANENGDISVEAMLTSGKNSVNTTVKGATLENDQIHIGTNSYAVWTNDEDSPMRGISALYITFAQKTSFGDHAPFFYGSFNHLTFEGIQNGLYQDLKATKLTSSSTSDELTWEFDGFDPVLTDCRYFLAVIPTGGVEFNITGFEVSTPCGDEPTRDDPSVGTFSNYQQDILDKIPAEASFPFIGNGSYYYFMIWWFDQEVYLPSLMFFQTSENVTYFLSHLSQSGYSMSYTEDNYRVYHKQIGGSEYYYTFEYYDHGLPSEGLTNFAFTYCGIQLSDYHD